MGDKPHLSEAFLTNSHTARLYLLARGHIWPRHSLPLLNIAEDEGKHTNLCRTPSSSVESRNTRQCDITAGKPDSNTAHWHKINTGMSTYPIFLAFLKTVMTGFRPAYRSLFAFCVKGTKLVLVGLQFPLQFYVEVSCSTAILRNT